MSSDPTEEELMLILQEDLTSFIEWSFGELNPQTKFINGRHVELVAATIERCRTGQTKRLIINMPPRTLKSHAASVAFPAWLLGHNPALRIICVSYGQELADKHARDCRTLMSSAFYRRLFPRTILQPEKHAVKDFMTTAQGFRMSTSVGGVLTGRGANVIILDDILKPEDALSEVRRTEAIEWYYHSLRSRLDSQENGVIIIVMQRLHQQDLVGEVLDRENREDWEVLSLPAIAERDESFLIEGPLGNRLYVRKAGEVLHPERVSLETYRKIREDIGGYNFQSQYQQNPTSREGGVIKGDWIRYCGTHEWPKQFDYVLQSWDTAIKSGPRNDYSVCTTWGIRDEKFYLMDVFRERPEIPDLRRAVLELFQRHKPEKVLIEDKGSGTFLLQEFNSDSSIWCLEGYTPKQSSDKLMRFAAQSIKFEGGKVILPRHAPWLDEYVREITAFPGSTHDDQVDSTSQALDILGPLAGIMGSGWNYLPRLRGYETC